MQKIITYTGAPIAVKFSPPIIENCLSKETKENIIYDKDFSYTCHMIGEGGMGGNSAVIEQQTFNYRYISGGGGGHGQYLSFPITNFNISSVGITQTNDPSQGRTAVAFNKVAIGGISANGENPGSTYRYDGGGIPVPYVTGGTGINVLTESNIFRAYTGAGGGGGIAIKNKDYSVNDIGGGGGSGVSYPNGTATGGTNLITGNDLIVGYVGGRPGLSNGNNGAYINKDTSTLNGSNGPYHGAGGGGAACSVTESLIKNDIKIGQGGKGGPGIVFVVVVEK